VVKRFLALLNKDISSINQAALLLGLTLLGSQVLGLVRDRTLASQLGPSDILDIYYAAFRIPDILYAVAAALVSVTILMPFFAELWEKDKDHDSAKQFLSEILTVFLAFMVVLSVLLFIAMPWLVQLVAPGFSPDMLQELTWASRILLLSPIFFGISNIFGVVTQSKRAFLAFGLSPVMYNVGIILGVIVLFPWFGLEGLIAGVVIGAMLHAAIQLPVLLRHRTVPRVVRVTDWKRIRGVVSVSVPRTLTLALSQITLAVLLAIASLIGEGAVSVFSFARNIQSVPLALIGMTFSVAAFPTLVETYTKRNMKKFVDHIVSPLQQILFWSFPVMVLFIVLRAQIVRVILGSGEFNWDDTRLTAAVFALLVLAVVAQSAVLLFVRGYYAAGKTWRPFTVNLISSSVAVGLALFLYRVYADHPGFVSFLERLMRVEGVEGTQVLVLAFSFAVGSIVNVTIMWSLFRKEFLQGRQAGILRTAIQSLSVSILMGAVAYSGLQIGAVWFDQNQTLGVFLQGLLGGGLAILVGAWLFWAIGNEEFLEILSAVRKKFWKAKIGSVDTPTN